MTTVIAELLKHGDKDLWKKIHQLITFIWRQLNILNNRQVEILQPTCKKGDKLECFNYKPIMLLNITYKVLPGAIYNRLVEHAEEILGEYKCEF